MVGKSKSKDAEMSKKCDVTTTAATVTTKEGDVTAAVLVEAAVVEPIKKMKSIILTSTGSGSDYANLQVKDEEYPKIMEGHENMVIVRMKAVGLNCAELMQRQGVYKPSIKTPYTPGFEGSGCVEEVSANIGDLKKDDRVMVLNPSGTWKEFVMVPRCNVFQIPDNMTYEDASAFLVNFLTAYQIVFRMANVREGDKVLIDMAGGDVGMAATQLCKTIPNVTVFGTANVLKHEAIKANGVDHAIDYKASDYVEQIRKISPEGVDVVLDPLNGENSIKGFDLLRPLGRIVHYGTASMAGETKSLANMFKTWWKCLSINSLEIVSENKSVAGYHLGHLLNNNAATFMPTAAKDIECLLNMWKEEKIKVIIDKTYGYSKVGEAMKRLHQRLNVGKIILKPDSEMPILVETATPATAPETAVETLTATLEEVKISTEVKANEDKAENEENCATSPKAAVERAEEKIIEKTNVGADNICVSKPEIVESANATRE